VRDFAEYPEYIMSEASFEDYRERMKHIKRRVQIRDRLKRRPYHDL
jgi:hypothetical protein